jgi:hypothetical protein
MLVEVFECNSNYRWNAVYNGIDTVVGVESLDDWLRTPMMMGFLGTNSEAVHWGTRK